MGTLGDIWTVHNAYLGIYWDIHIKIHVTELNNNQPCFYVFKGRKTWTVTFFPVCPLGNSVTVWCDVCDCLKCVPLISFFSKSLSIWTKASWDSSKSQLLKSTSACTTYLWPCETQTDKVSVQHLHYSLIACTHITKKTYTACAI